jgi:photosystem I subunit XI
MSDPRNQEMVSIAGDPQIGNLITPINGSGFTKAFLSNLPAYRKGLSPLLRGLEIGMAHGYWLFGPFTYTSQFRLSKVADIVGLIEAVLLVVIATLAMSLYANTNPPKPVAVTPLPSAPDALSTQEGWTDLASGFLVGGIGGAGFAFLVYKIVNSGVFESFGSFGS